MGWRCCSKYINTERQGIPMPGSEKNTYSDFIIYIKASMASSGAEMAELWRWAGGGVAALLEIKYGTAVQRDTRG